MALDRSNQNWPDTDVYELPEYLAGEALPQGAVIAGESEPELEMARR